MILLGNTTDDGVYCFLFDDMAATTKWMDDMIDALEDFDAEQKAEFKNDFRAHQTVNISDDDCWSALSPTDYGFDDLTTKPIVAVTVEGGCVQGVTCDRESEVVVVDYDIEGATEEELDDVPQYGPDDKEVVGTAQAYVRPEQAHVNADQARELLAIASEVV
jgi:hypothetical protein